MDIWSPELREILDAVSTFATDKERGRARLLELWEALLPQRNPLQLCTLGHFLADTETEPENELEWDLRALEAATGTRAPEDRGTIPPVPEGYLPSLHLNVANSYRRVGDLERARHHVVLGSRHVGALGDDAYGAMVRGGLHRLEAALATTGEVQTTQPGAS